MGPPHGAAVGQCSTLVRVCWLGDASQDALAHVVEGVVRRSSGAGVLAVIDALRGRVLDARGGAARVPEASAWARVVEAIASAPVACEHADLLLAALPSATVLQRLFDAGATPPAVPPPTPRALAAVSSVVLQLPVPLVDDVLLPALERRIRAMDRSGVSGDALEQDVVTLVRELVRTFYESRMRCVLARCLQAARTSDARE